MPGITSIKIKAMNITDVGQNDGHALYILPQISIFINNSSNFHQPANKIIIIIFNRLTWSIYMILQPLQNNSILNPFLKPTTQDQKLTPTPEIYAIKLVPTVTCSLQPSDPKLPTNHLSKNYLKPGKENLPQTKS